MESGENSSSMQSSSTGGGGGDDQEYESSRGGGRGRGGGGGGRGNYNYNLVFNNSNINEGSVNYTTSPTMLLNHMIRPSPQLPSWSFGDPNFHNLMLWQQQPQPQPQPQPRVVAAGTSTSCTTSLINDFRPPNQSPFSGDPGRDSLLTSSSTTATVAAESVAGKYHATNPPHTAAGVIGSDTGMGTGSGTGTSGNKSNTSSTKNPRKRTRASRRAPTTVLTTDTSNFRAMVQEFTGIPSSPFSPGAATSPLLSHRLSDLFATSVPIPGSSAFGLGPFSSSLSFRHAGYSTTDHNHLSNLIRPSANASCYTSASAPTIQKPTDHHHQLHLNYSSSSSPSSSATDLRFHPISSAAGGMTSTSNTQQAGLSTVSSFQQLMMGSDFQHQMLMSTTDHNFRLSGSGDGSRNGGFPAAIPLDLPENKADTAIGNQAGRGGGGGDDDNK